MAIAKKWDGLCSYCGKASKGRALCNKPVNTHAWKTPQQYNPGFMCGREDTMVPKKDLFFIQISWAGGKGCKGDHNSDQEAATGVMCAQVDKHGAHMRSRKCDQTEDLQLFRMQELTNAIFKGKTNTKNVVGVYRLHSKADDSKCLTWDGIGCARYTFQTCQVTPNDSGHQVFHLSRFVDDNDDTDVFTWAGADGRAMDANSCNGWKDGNVISHCTDNGNQAKRWQMLVTDVELNTFTAYLSGKNGVSAHDCE